jgi:O-antigen ligase
LKGMIAGALIETVGNLFIFFSSQGESRGYWLGLDNYKIQVFLLVACCISLFQEKIRWWKIVAGLLLLVGILATETRTAFILLLVCLFLLLLTHGRKMLKPIFAFLVVAGMAVAPILLFLPGAEAGLTKRAEQVWTGEGSIGYRIILYEMAAVAYLTHPITGIGSGGFGRQQDTLYPQIGDAFAPEYEALHLQVSTHNTVLGVAAETGTLGLIAYFLWVAAVVRICLNAIRLERIHRDLYVLASCICLLAMLTQDWWGQASFMPASTCLLGFVLGWCREHGLPKQLGSGAPPLSLPAVAD